MPSIWITDLQDGLGSRNWIDSWSNEFPTFPAESQNTAMKHLESPQTWGMRTCSCGRAQVFICTFAWKRYKLTMLGEEGDENSVERDAYKYIVQQASRNLPIFSKHTEKTSRWPVTISPQFKKHVCFVWGQVGAGSRWVHLKDPRWSEIPTAWVAAGGSSPAQFLDSTCRWEHLGPLQRFGETGGILTTQRWLCALHIPLMIIIHLECYFGNWRTLMHAYNFWRGACKLCLN